MFRSIRSRAALGDGRRRGAHDVRVLAEELDRRPARGRRSARRDGCAASRRRSSRCRGGRRSSTPSPRRRARRRSAWPAGARTSCRCRPAARARRGSGSSTPPRVQGSVSRAPARAQSEGDVALVQQAQPGQRQQVVDLVDRLRERDDVPRQAAGRDRRAPSPSSRPAGAGRSRRPGRRSRRRCRCGSRRPSTCRSASAAGEVDLRQLRAALVSASSVISTPGDDHAAEVLAVGGHRVVRDRGAEVDDDDRPADLRRTRRPRSRAGRRRSRAGCRSGSRSRSGCRGRRRASRGRGSGCAIDVHSGPSCGHGRRDDRRARSPKRDAAELEQAAQRRAELVGGRLADRREAPVLDELVAAVGAEVRLGVADVDDEQHGRAV